MPHPSRGGSYSLESLVKGLTIRLWWEPKLTVTAIAGSTLVTVPRPWESWDTRSLSSKTLASTGTRFLLNGLLGNSRALMESSLVQYDPGHQRRPRWGIPSHALALTGPLVQVVAQDLRTRRVAQLRHGLGFNLANPLTSNAINLADFVQRLGLSIGQTKAHRHHTGFALGQGV